MTKNKKNLSNEIVSTDVNIENTSLKKRALTKLGHIGLSLFSTALIIGSTRALVGSVYAVDAAKEDEKKVIKAKELKKSVFLHGIKVETSIPDDLVECNPSIYLF